MEGANRPLHNRKNEMNINEPEPLTLNETTKKYPRLWIAAQVVERDNESGQPLKFKLLLRDADLYAARSGLKLTDYCTFYTGPIPEIAHVGMF
jgi:hypothetical protein